MLTLLCYINIEIAFASNGPNTRLLHLNSGIQCHFNPLPISHRKNKELQRLHRCELLFSQNH